MPSHRACIRSIPGLEDGRSEILTWKILWKIMGKQWKSYKTLWKTCDILLLMPWNTLKSWDMKKYSNCHTWNTLQTSVNAMLNEMLCYVLYTQPENWPSLPSHPSRSEWSQSSSGVWWWIPNETIGTPFYSIGPLEVRHSFIFANTDKFMVLSKAPNRGSLVPTHPQTDINQYLSDKTIAWNHPKFR